MEEHLLKEDEVKALYRTGNACAESGEDDAAAQSFKAALKLDPSHTGAGIGLAQVYDRLGNAAASERAYLDILTLNPNNPQANHALAKICLRKQQHIEAEKYIQTSIASSPGNHQFLLTLAKALKGQKRHQEAEEIYTTTLQDHADDALGFIELGQVLSAQGKIDEAAEAYSKAVRLAPKNTVALGQAGYFYQTIRQYDTATELYQRYLEIDPDDIAILTNIGMVQSALKQIEEAKHFFLRALQLTDSPARLLNNLASLHSDPREALNLYQRALAEDPSYSAARSNVLMYLNFLEDIPVSRVFQEHRQWQRWHAEPLPAEMLFYKNIPDPDRRLRIGYLSGDFSGHVVSYFIEGALARHDRDHYEIFCYSNVKTPDGTTERLKSYGHHWQSVVGVSAADAADLIRHDGIDILVDLNGHTSRNRLDILAKKPAPIQVSWIGYPNTLGLETVDYRLVDNITDPQNEADEYYVEKLLRLPGPFLCYTTTSTFPFSDKLYALQVGHVTFGSFNRISKVSPSTLATWAHILTRVKGSRLIIKSTSPIDRQMHDQMLDAFTRCGVSTDRIEILGELSPDAHLRLYDKIDIALDTFPYNGTTTTCEAMWMGVPVVCLQGDRHATRVSASLISQVGLDECVANSQDEYVEIAVKLSGDLEHLENLRKNLRETMLSSPLCDAKTHTMGVESAYREMWETWCRGELSHRAQRRNQRPPETEWHKPPIRIIHALGNRVFSQLCECLDAMNGIGLLNDMHPLGMSIFNPIEEAQNRHELFDDDEWEVVTRKKLSFSECMSRIQARFRHRNQELVITDWNHLDFIAKPYLPKASNTLFSNSELSRDFDVKDIFVVRHPLPQWMFYCAATNVSDYVDVDEFLAGYRRFAEMAVEGVWFRCEDFAADPAEVLGDMCKHLGLLFDPDILHPYRAASHIPGEASGRSSKSRTKKEIQAPIPQQGPPELQARLQQSDDYAYILRLLEYDKPKDSGPSILE